MSEENKTEKPAEAAVDPMAYIPDFVLPEDPQHRSVLVASCPPAEEVKRIKLKKKPKTVAVVDEDSCVGCEYCLHVCPVPNCLALVSVRDPSAQIETTCIANWLKTLP